MTKEITIIKVLKGRAKAASDEIARRTGLLYYRCVICNKSFDRYDDVLDHAQRDHERIWNQYKTIDDYKKAVKEGKEKDLKKGDGSE